MNDLMNNNTKHKNIEELYHRILIIVEKLYSDNVPNSVKKRKNKEKSKMTDSQIISIQLLIECIGKTQNSGYLYLIFFHFLVVPLSYLIF